MERTKGIKAALPYFVVILLLHIIGVVFLMIGGASHPLIIGMGVVAYTLGLRHAFDADHIAAIDNTVRKLLEQQRNSMGVGFYFSLGHSTVVFLMAVMLGVSRSLGAKPFSRFSINRWINRYIGFWIFLIINWAFKLSYTDSVNTIIPKIEI